MTDLKLQVGIYSTIVLHDGNELTGTIERVSSKMVQLVTPADESTSGEVHRVERSQIDRVVRPVEGAAA